MFAPSPLASAAERKESIRSTVTQLGSPSGRGAILQRKCACGGTPGPTGECDECRKKREAGILQRRVTQPSAEISRVPSVAPSVRETLGSSGTPLDAATRADLELQFGYDFSKVKIHADAKAAGSARDVNALAYTVGRDVVFGAGQYSPGTSAGRTLLAHELAHVVQQGAATYDSSSPLKIDAPDSPLERQAEQAGRRARFQSRDGLGSVGKNPSRATPVDLPLPVVETRSFQTQNRSPAILQRQPREAKDEHAEEENQTDKNDQKYAPWFAKATPVGFLPGDSVRGVPANGSHYTEADRQKLLSALDRRQQENATNAPAFASNYAASLLEVWSAFEREEMVKSLEDAGWPLWAKILGFAVRETLLAFLFPEKDLERLAEKVVMTALEKSTAFGYEHTQAGLEEGAVESDAEKRSEELAGQTEKVAKLTEAISPVIQSATNAYYYRDFLATASLEDLSRFRIPHLIPKVTVADMKARMAVAIATFLNSDEASNRGDEENSLTVDIAPVLLPGRIQGSTGQFVAIKGADPSQPAGARFIGARSLEKNLIGHPVGEMRRIPLRIEVHAQSLNLYHFVKNIAPEIGDYIQAQDPQVAAYYAAVPPGRKLTPEQQLTANEVLEPGTRETSVSDLFYRGTSEKLEATARLLAGSGPSRVSQIDRLKVAPIYWYLASIREIEESWPGKSPLRIVRNGNGAVELEGGNLVEHYSLYEMANPGTDLVKLVGKFAQGVNAPVTPHRTAAMAARELAAFLGQSGKEGAELLISDAVEPLKIKQSVHH